MIYDRFCLHIREVALGLALSANALILFRGAVFPDWVLWVAAGLYATAGTCCWYFVKVLCGPGIPRRDHRYLCGQGYRWYRTHKAYYGRGVELCRYNRGWRAERSWGDPSPMFADPVAAHVWTRVENWGWGWDAQ